MPMTSLLMMNCMMNRTNQRLDGQFQDATEPIRYNCFKLDVLELLGICSLVTEENFTKTKSLNHFFVSIDAAIMIFQFHIFHVIEVMYTRL